MSLIVEWVLAQHVAGLVHTVVKDEGRTPVLLFEVPAYKSALHETVLMYGHLDKQPPMTAAWAPGLHPHVPVIRDGKLYGPLFVEPCLFVKLLRTKTGRGGADDGYSTFAAITAVKALQDQGVPHPRIVILIEAAEESGSPDLDHYVTRLSPSIGNVGLIICLDSGTHNYEQMWVTTSLRGVLGVTLRVEVLRHGVHSGSASGIVPSSFRGIRAILDKLEDKESGKVLVPELHVPIPQYRIDEAKKCAEILGRHVVEEFPWIAGVKPMTTNVAEVREQKKWEKKNKSKQKKRKKNSFTR